MKSALFRDVTQLRVVFPYRCFGTTYRSHLQGSNDILSRNVGTELPFYSVKNLRGAQMRMYGFALEHFKIIRNKLKYSSTAICVICIKESPATKLVDMFIHLPNLVNLNSAICWYSFRTSVKHRVVLHSVFKVAYFVTYIAARWIFNGCFVAVKWQVSCISWLEVNRQNVSVHNIEWFVSFIIKPTRCTDFTNLFWHETLRVSDSSCAHHQEFIHCTLSNGL